MLKQYLCTMRYFIGEYLLIEPIKNKESNSLSKECRNRHFSCQRIAKKLEVEFVISFQTPSTCMNSQTRGWIFCPRFPCMTQTSCLTTAFCEYPLTCFHCSCIVSMNFETKGQKKLREAREEQVRLLAERTTLRVTELLSLTELANKEQARLLAEEASIRVAELLSLSEIKSQDKSTQTDWPSCSYCSSSVNLPE